MFMCINVGLFMRLCIHVNNMNEFSISGFAAYADIYVSICQESPKHRKQHINIISITSIFKRQVLLRQRYLQPVPLWQESYAVARTGPRTPREEANHLKRLPVKDPLLASTEQTPLRAPVRQPYQFKLVSGAFLEPLHGGYPLEITCLLCVLPGVLCRHY